MTKQANESPKTPPRPKSKEPPGPKQVPSDTPLSARLIGGRHLQHNLRSLIMEEMADEMLECSLDAFMQDYAPFNPSEQSVDDALQQYINMHPEKLKKVAGNAPGGETQRGWVWADFDVYPSNMNAREVDIYRKLQVIIDVLGELDFVCREQGQAPRQRQFHYRDCPSKTMESEIDGTAFRVDACITEDPNAQKIVLAETVVVAEFKKHSKEVEENRSQLVSAANHIMNDDPRRTWVYGITIEDNMMSLWYFCRSHSVKSEAFDFTTDIKTFIRVFLSLLYATREEIGYDPTVHRVRYKGNICYVYEMGTSEAPMYFRTIDPLFNQRVLCITGRKTRVWKAVEVEGFEDDKVGKVKNGGSEVALKDAWHDVGSKTEKENLDTVFARLKNVKEEDYSWAPPLLKKHLKRILQNEGYKDYFMEIKQERVLGSTKPRSKSAIRAPDLLRWTPKEPKTASGNITKGSTQTIGSYGLPANIFVRRSGKPPARVPREYRIKQHRRLIYDEVGCSLHDAKDLPTSFCAVRDAFVALVLLYLARWVHRDVSTGNIIMVKRKDGSVGGKLSDFEYAKAFINDQASPDPKTGTPYFMPLEIHESKSLYNPHHEMEQAVDWDLEVDPEWNLSTFVPEGGARAESSDGPNSSDSGALSVNLPPPKFRFQHDLESLWWILLWILLYRVKYPKALGLANEVFTYTSLPSRQREDLFKMKSFSAHLSNHIHPRLISCVGSLGIYRTTLYNSYRDEEGFKNMLDPATYTGIYANVWLSLSQLATAFSTLSDIVLRDDASVSEERGQQSQQKRSRSRTLGDTDDVDGTDNANDIDDTYADGDADYEPEDEGVDGAGEEVVKSIKRPKKKQKQGHKDRQRQRELNGNQVPRKRMRL